MIAWMLLACMPPDLDGLFNSVQMEVRLGEAEAGLDFAEVIANATDSAHVALPGGDNLDIAEAIVEAWDRGLEVEVISDVDLATSPAIAVLTDAAVPLFLADGGLTYFDFAIEREVGWSSDQTRFTDAWAVADRRTIVAANRIGFNGDDTRIVLTVEGEDIVDDLLLEHNQLFGGTDATSINAYSNPTKSILETRWRYGTETPLELELWFGPQERLLKRVIDGVYGARSSVWIVTDDFLSDGLAAALQQKAADGFEVEVVVGPHFGDGDPILARALEDDTPDVAKRAWTTGDHVPTIVLVDWSPDEEGVQPESSAMVLTHELLSAPRLYAGTPVLTDQLVDGTMWTFASRTGPDEPVLRALEAVYRDHWDQAEDL